MDAKITAQLIDDVFTKIHKLCQHTDVEQLISSDKKHEKLYSMIYTSYIQSMEFVKYVNIPSYGNYTSFSEMAVVAIEDIQKNTEIGGMKGFGAKLKKDQLSQSSQFSYFKRLGINDMVMLGPASFINHNCEPNCQYICRGERNSTIIFIKTKRALVRGEELTVSYSDDYFEPGNVDCKCPSCASKKTTPIEVAAQLSPSSAATQEEDQLPLPEELDVAAQLSPPPCCSNTRGGSIAPS